MRWDQLFDDLESQLESELGADDADVRAEEERLRLGRLALRDRLIGVHANGSGLVRLGIVGGKRLIVRPMAFGRDWLSGELIAESHRRTQCVVPLSAVAAVVLGPHELDASLTEPSGDHARVLDRIGFSSVVRDLCRRRAAVTIVTDAGDQHGTIDRVGRDHCDLAVHESGQPRRAGLVRELRILPFAHIRLLSL